MKTLFFSILNLCLGGMALGTISGLVSSAPTGPLPFTGDHTPFGLIIGVMVVALIAIIVVVISMRRKK